MKKNYLQKIIYLLMFCIVLSMLNITENGFRSEFVFNITLLLISLYFLFGLIMSLTNGVFSFRGSVIKKSENREVFYFFIAIIFLLFCYVSAYLISRIF